MTGENGGIDDCDGIRGDQYGGCPHSDEQKYFLIILRLFFKRKNLKGDTKAYVKKQKVLQEMQSKGPSTNSIKKRRESLINN